MIDKRCEVCGVNEPIGVACTVMPYSCAYCATCARRFAQPLVVFECFYDDVGTDLSKFEDDFYGKLETFHDGRYVTYAEWSKWRAEHA
jgi:hypothetical protein